MTEERVVKYYDGEGGRTELLKPTYDVICRRRLIQKKRKHAAQFNRELNHMIAMKTKAVDGIKLDLLFSCDD